MKGEIKKGLKYKIIDKKNEIFWNEIEQIEINCAVPVLNLNYNNWIVN